MRKYFLYLMAALYVLAGLNHFRNPAFYMQIMPPWLPWHYPLVLLSGVAEVIVGILLLMPPHTLAGSMADYSFITRYFSRQYPDGY